MKNAPTGKTIPADGTDWSRVRAMQDADIHYDADSPSTKVSDWEGATLKQNGVEVGRAKTRGPNRRPTKEQVAVRYSPDVLAAFAPPDEAGRHAWMKRCVIGLKPILRRSPSFPSPY